MDGEITLSSQGQDSDPHARAAELERGFRPVDPSPTRLADVLTVAGAAVTRPLPDAAVVTGVCLDSRAVQPGDLYAALPGAHTHGARFAAQAVQRGAAAILTDAAGAADLEPTPAQGAVPVLVAEDPRARLGAVSELIYSTATHGPETYAVTGTNGKTTTTYMLRSLLQALGRVTGLIGTIEILAGDEPIPSVLTTPEAPQLHALMARMAEAGVEAAAMEVSSHSLTFERVAGLHFEVSGFTNLTQDHLDMHGSMENYLAAKAELFTPGYTSAAVVTVDDEWGARLARDAAGRGVDTVTLATGHGAGAAQDASADYRVTEVSPAGLGSAFLLTGPDGLRLRARTDLPGSFNVSNAALALVMLLRGGTTADQLEAALGTDASALTPLVPGRMQVVHRHPTAVVDFAHNPDALVRALDSLDAGDGRKLVVFGATGERDTTKRPIMGRLAAEHADVVLVTDDDPHGEDPAQIRAQVMQGAEEAAGADVTVVEVAPRAAAIAEAVRLARAEDVILVAGRGHEVYQEVDGVNLALDDREELIKSFEHGVGQQSAPRSAE